MTNLQFPPDFPRITQSTGRVLKRDIDGVDHVLIVLPPKPAAKTWKQTPGSAQLQAAERRAGSGQLLQGRLDNKRGTGLTARRLPADSPGMSRPVFSPKPKRFT